MSIIFYCSGMNHLTSFVSVRGPPTKVFLVISPKIATYPSIFLMCRPND